MRSPRPAPALLCLLTFSLLAGCGNDSANNTDLLRKQQQQREIDRAAPESDTQRLAKAQQRLRDGDIDRAEAAANRLLIARPEDAEVILLAAKCRRARGDVMAAAELVDSISRDDVDAKVVALDEAARWLTEIDRLDLAATRLREILQLKGETNHRLHRLAKLMNNQGRRIEAKPYLRSLARSGDATEKELYAMNCFADAFIDESLPPPRPGEPLTMTSLAKAKALLADREFGEAASLAVALRAKFPDSTQVAAFQGHMLAEMQADEALALWSANLPNGIAAEPEYWRAIGHWAGRRGDHRQAVRCFAEAVKIDDTDRFAYLGLARSLLAVGQKVEAEEATRRYEWLDESSRIAAKIGRAPGTREQLERMAYLLDRLQRPWEAISWREVAARTHGASEKERALLRQKRVALAATDQPAATDPPGDPHWQTCGIDLSEWPLPEGIAPASLPDSIANPLDTPRSPIRLANVASQAGLDFRYLNGDLPDDDQVFLHQLTGGGIGVIDYDLDGWPDLYLSQAGGDAFDHEGSEPNRLFRNSIVSATQRWHDVSTGAAIGDRGYGQGVAVADLNQDGFPDIVVANIGVNRVLINNGDGTFRRDTLPTDRTITADIDAEASSFAARGGWTTSVAVGDLNGDALPDIVEVNYVDDPSSLTTPCVNNEGLCNPSRFRPASDRIIWGDESGQFSSQESPSQDLEDDLASMPSHGFAAVIANFDHHAGNDLFIANDADRNHHWKSESVNGSGTFTLVECAEVLGLATGLQGAHQGCMGVAAADFDHNGRLDLHVTNFWNQPSDLYLQDGFGLFDNRAVPMGLFTETRRTVGWGTQAVDLDRDGNADLAVLNGHVTDRSSDGIPYAMPPQLFRGLRGRFRPEGVESPDSYWTTPAHARTLAVMDWNRDGLPDLVAGHLDASLALLENRTAPGHWLQLELVGRESERDAVGAWVEVTAAETTHRGWVTGGDGFLSSNESMLDFGLGSATRVDQIVVHWPSGKEQTLAGPPIDGRYLVIEGERGWTAR